MGVSDDWSQARIPQDILFRTRPQVQTCTWALSLPNVDRVTLAPGLHVLGSPGPPPPTEYQAVPGPRHALPLNPLPSSLTRSRSGMSVCSLTTHTLNSYPQPEGVCGWALGGGLTLQL